MRLGLLPLFTLSLLIPHVALAAPEGKQPEPAKDPEYTTVVTSKLGPEPLYSADRSISVVDKRRCESARRAPPPRRCGRPPGCTCSRPTTPAAHPWCGA